MYLYFRGGGWGLGGLTQKASTLLHPAATLSGLKQNCVIESSGFLFWPTFTNSGNSIASIINHHNPPVKRKGFLFLLLVLQQLITHSTGAPGWAGPSSRSLLYVFSPQSSLISNSVQRLFCDAARPTLKRNLKRNARYPLYPSPLLALPGRWLH